MRTSGSCAGSCGRSASTARPRLGPSTRSRRSQPLPRPFRRATTCPPRPCALRGTRKSMLEFAPLDPPPLPDGLRVPDEFVAVDSAAEAPAVVALDGLDGAGRAAVLARASSYFGTDRAAACEAIFLGVPAVV